MIMSISFVCPYENKFSTTIQNKSSMFLQNILTIIENIKNNFSCGEIIVFKLLNNVSSGS